MAKQPPPKKPRKIFIEGDLPSSLAWLTLTNTSKEVLLLFYCKKQMAKIKGKRDDWVITNNGSITFTYNEAKKEGYPGTTFSTAIGQLVEVGFLDIASSGSGMFKQPTRFAISERWRKYGTLEFVQKKRPPRPKHGQHIGFQKGHAPMGNRKKATTKIGSE